MYNKYLVYLYTSVVDRPDLAESLALTELDNRATPQTYAWYSYSLLCNHKPVEAKDVYDKHVSGKPLEAQELYYMGKLMQALKKGYTAGEYFKEANKNRFDLFPAVNKDLSNQLKNK
jgi:hypothetical protein